MAQAHSDIITSVVRDFVEWRHALWETGEPPETFPTGM